MSHAVPAGDGPWDPGLQPERAALAWQRTGFAVASASLVGARGGLVSGSVLAVVSACLALVAGLVVLRSSRTELGARVEALRSGQPLPAPVATYAAVVAVVALCVTVLALALG